MDKISAIQALLLGIIEGITEFLPISSTGHLLVSSQMMGAANSAGTFEVVIQLGAIVAVVLFYWKKLWRQMRTFPRSGSSRRFWCTLIAAFIPAAVVGLAFDDLIDSLLSDSAVQAYVISFTLVVGGIILLVVDRDEPNTSATQVELTEVIDSTESSEVSIENSRPREQGLSFRQAIWIGIAQCFALIPGVSRSASTIVGGLLVGLSRAKATEFSFFLSIPTLGAATIYKFVKDYDKLIQVCDLGTLTIGTIVSFIAALLSIGWLLRYVSSHTFKGFAIYRIIAGFIILCWAWHTY